MTLLHGSPRGRLLRSLAFVAVLSLSLVFGMGLVFVLADAMSDDSPDVAPIELVTGTTTTTLPDTTTGAPEITAAAPTPVTTDAPTSPGSALVPVAPPPQPPSPLVAPPPAPAPPPPPIAPDDDDDDDDDDAEADDDADVDVDHDDDDDDDDDD